MHTELKDLWQTIESRVDITTVLNHLGFKKGSGDDNYYCILPGHDDKAASFIASQGEQVWTCMGTCQASGNIYQLVSKFRGVNILQATKEVAGLAGIPDSEIQIDKSRVEVVGEKLKPLTPIQKEYLNHRGIKISTADFFGLKSHRNLIAFPQKISGNVVAYKFLNPSDKKSMFVEGEEKKAKLWPDSDLTGYKKIFISAGEYDTMYLWQKAHEYGESDIGVFSNSLGEGSVPNNIINAVKKAGSIEEISIFYDHDEAGKKGANKLADALSVLNIPVYIYYFPDDSKKGYDISDFFNEGYSLTNLLGHRKEKYDTRKNDITTTGDIFDLQRSILSAIIADNALILDMKENEIQLKFFTDYRFQEIYKLILLYNQDFSYCSFDLLKNKISDHAILQAVDEIIGAYAIGSVDELYDCLEKLKLNHCRLEFQRLKSRIDLLLQGENSRVNLLNEASKMLNDVIMENTEDKRTKTLQEILLDYGNSIGDTETLRFITTPFKKLNEELQDGFRVGKVTLIGAYPSAGKTTFTRQCADFAASNGVSTVMYVLETEHEEVAEMTLSDRNNINNVFYKKKSFPGIKDPFEMVGNSIKNYDDSLLFVESFDMTGSQIIDDIRLKKRRYDVKFVVIDLLHALDLEKGYSDMTSYFSSLMTKFVKLALIENIALVVNCHFRRKERGSSGVVKKPTLDSFADTSNLEKRAYCALALYKDNGVMMVGVLKNRGNRKDEHFPITFLPHLSRFEDMK